MTTAFPNTHSSHSEQFLASNTQPLLLYVRLICPILFMGACYLDENTVSVILNEM